MLRYGERRKTYGFEVSVDDSRVVHVEQAPGYVYKLQSKVGQEPRKEGVETYQWYSPGKIVPLYVFPKASVFHEVVHESQWVLRRDVRGAERDDVAMGK